MSSIPYPNIAALGGEIAAAPQNAIAEAARTRALETQTQGQGLQNQVMQQQLKDQQAMTAALHEWDGKDISSLPGLVIKHGASANAVLGLKNNIIEQQTKLATLGKDQLANTQAQHTQIANAISPLIDPKGVADADLSAQIHSVGQGLLQSGTLDPQHEQEIERLAQLAQTDPQGARQQLDFHRKAYLGQAALAEIAKNTAQAGEATGKGEQATAEAALTNIKVNVAKNSKPGDYDAQIDQIFPPNATQNAGSNHMTKALVNGALSRGDFEGAQRVLDQAYQSQQGIQKEIAVATNPQVQSAKEKVAAVEGAARAAAFGQNRQYPVFDNVTKQTVYLDPNEINEARMREPGRYTVPSFTADSLIQQGTGKAFAPGGKAGEELTAFNTAIQHADLLQKASDALKNGDVRALNTIGNQLGVQFGSDKATNFQVIANAYTREVTKALSAGHLTDAEIKEQGATMPANASPEQIKGALNAYKNLMASKVNVRKQQFEAGTQGKPNFGGGTQSGPPAGATHTAMGSDGNRHYTNAQGQDLGIAP